jgi:hypothetical protein
MTSNSYTVETFLDFLEDTTKHTDRVLDRHTRHYGSYKVKAPPFSRGEAV